MKRSSSTFAGFLIALLVAALVGVLPAGATPPPAAPVDGPATSTGKSAYAPGTCFAGSEGPGSTQGATPIPDLTRPWPPAPCTPPLACSTPLTGSHHTYNVGPDQAYPDLTGVPWLSLGAGDVVNIFYRPQPYATKVGLRAQGTATKPVIINGVTDANCNRPIVTGVNAVTATDAASKGFFTGPGGSIIEGFGVFIVFKLPSDPYGYKATFLAIQNLQIEGGTASSTYTAASGQSHNFYRSASGIYVVAASNLTIQNCEIKGNGEGVFVNTKNGTFHEASYYITLRGNSIHDNGVVGSWLEHNVYVQAVRALYEGNYIGQLIPGAWGGSLKDRSSGAVIRYNYILAAARAIDLVDSEGGSETVQADPLYNYAWVYGNLIVNGPRGSGDLIHWGGDSTLYQNYHQGPLAFYFNTIVNSVETAVFDMATSQGMVDAHSNIITGKTALSLCTNSNADGNQVGQLALRDANWIQSGYKVGACTLSSQGTLLSGSPLLTADYGLPPGSRAIGAGVPYPSAPPPAPASLEALLPTFSPATAVNGHPTYVPRATLSDLGAFAAR
jgi:hypothetical protein